MKEKKYSSVIKWSIYSALLIILFSLQTTPNLFLIFAVKPILILPLCVCVAMLEGILASSIFGLIAGLLWDISSDKLFGFNGLIFMFICMIISLLCVYYLRTKWLNAAFFTMIAALLQGLIDYVFYFAIWRYDNSVVLIYEKIIPTAIYSSIVTPIIFIVIGFISKKFSENVRA